MKGLRTLENGMSVQACNRGCKGNGGQVKKILKHLGLWDQKACPPSVWRARPPPRKGKPPGIIETPMDFSVSQLPPSEEHLFFDVEYPAEDPVFNGEAVS